MSRMPLLAVALVSLVTACGGSPPKEVTKAQYERAVQRLGQDLTNAGSQLGQSIDIATFNGNVDNLKEHLEDAADDLHGLKPPPNARSANERLADALDDFAGMLDDVKEARRKSIYRARDALQKVSDSMAVRQARAATRELKRLGYEIGQFGAL